MRKNVPMFLIVALLLLLSGCGTGDLQSVRDIQGDTYADAEQYTAGNFTYNPADVDAVELCWRVGDIELIEGDGDMLAVSESGTDLKPDTQMYHYLDGHILRIRFCQSGASVHVADSDKHLTVELPKGIDLSIYNTDASVHAGNLEQNKVFISSYSANLECGVIVADSIDLSSSSGDIRVDWATGGSLSIATVSGKVEVGNTVLTDSFDITSVSGKVAVGELNAGALEVSTTSANVDIKTVLSCPNIGITTTGGRISMVMPETGGQVTFATISGDLKTDRDYKTTGDLMVFGDGGTEIGVVTISGDLELR